MSCQFPWLDLNEWASLATVLGVVVATGTLLAAFMQYRASKRTAHLAHINGLFRDLLRLEFDFNNSPKVDAKSVMQSKTYLQAYRMWVLEEMWVWLRGVRKRIRWTKAGRAQQERFVATWEATLAYHACKLSAEGRQDFINYEPCYDAEFHHHVLELTKSRRIFAKSVGNTISGDTDIP